MATLELKDVVGGYGDTQILHGVSITVDPDEIVVIIGPNGAGKSTAIKAVFGLLKLTGGQILLEGEDITNTPPEKVVRNGVCYVPQTANIFPSLTVEENLEMGAYVREDDFRPRLEEIYELFPPLREKRRQAAGTLSGGQRQMVAMGKALMLEPRILLLDEPTAGLSPKFRGDPDGRTERQAGAEDRPSGLCAGRRPQQIYRDRAGTARRSGGRRHVPGRREVRG
jgi:branched-chain amino acid transport system ATP-binding protein